MFAMCLACLWCVCDCLRVYLIGWFAVGVAIFAIGEARTEGASGPDRIFKMRGFYDRNI